MAEKDLAQNAVERLSEDEALRGDLSDVGFGPLLDWATAAVTAYAAHASKQEDVDQYTDRVRGVVQSAVADADAGQIDPITDLLDFDSADKAGTEAALKALKLSDDSDQNAVDIAGVLQAALQPASSKAESDQPKQETATAAEHTEVPTIAETSKTEAEPKLLPDHSHTEHKESKEAKKADNTKEAKEPKEAEKAKES